MSFFGQFSDTPLKERSGKIWGDHYFLPSLSLAIKLMPVDYFETNTFDPLQVQADCRMAKASGIQLVKIWQDEWSNQKAIIQSRLLSLLGKTGRIHGRSTKIKTLSANELKLFLAENHLQVSLNTKYKYGLEKDHAIRAVMAFSKPRNIARNQQIYRSYEMVRFSNELNNTVVGGFSKLLNHFIKCQHPDDIMTYADWEWSDGSVYEKHGFKLVDITTPQMFYVDRKTAQRLYPDRLLGSLTANPTEEELSKRYFKIYNSGNLKYLLTLK